ncbi:MAG: redox-regulated ATPase YchF [Deltaproteobacteria bacterium]|nr:redox-regulated ATPase YchF [Deltaproteobacteria bacterium]
MGFNCGIVGLPNVGKSTIFNALTSAAAAAENFPFCTIEPNTGIVPLRDPRLDRMAAISESAKVTPTTMEFVDIAGLVKGASQGEGLGNQFLAHIRAVDAIVQVVRCFDDPDVVHVHGVINPVEDADVVNLELLFADLETVERRAEKVEKLARVGKKESVVEAELLGRYREALRDNRPARSVAVTAEEQSIVQSWQLLTNKPMLYVANVGEKALKMLPTHRSYQQFVVFAKTTGAVVVPICGAIESEIAQLAPSDRAVFLADVGLEASGLDRLAHAGHRLLHLIAFFTTGPKETRAWTVREGTTAPEAAGKIHSDLERGFIRAETYQCDELFVHGSEAALRAKGLIRQEGKAYIVCDGDVMFFKFHV